MAPPLVLALDTSVAHCAVALLRGGEIVASAQEEMAKGQAERLLSLADEMLGQADVALADLDAIGVGIGPGNFTGVRISVSAARGLALALDIPAIGVSSLEAQAYGQHGVIVSSLDARRGMMYLQVLGDGATASPVLCSVDDLPSIPARSEPVCVGYQADLVAAHCAGRVAARTLPLAEAIARVAASRIDSTRKPPAPLYLRAADAAPARDAPPRIVP